MAITTSDDVGIKSLVTCSKGFAFGYKQGTIYFFEKEGSNAYRKRSVFKIPARVIERKNAEGEVETTILNAVNCISFNLNEDKLVATCGENQIYQARLWGPELAAQAEATVMTELGLPLHHGPIGGLDVCSWKPIFMTAGLHDRTVKVWNYETEVLEVAKTYLEDINTVSLHPTGLFAIIGFSDKLRFVSILIDDFTIMKEFPVRNCAECRFSTLGHLFAAVNGNIIQVYSSTTFEHMFNLKGHNGKVRCFDTLTPKFANPTYLQPNNCKSPMEDKD